MQVLAVPSVNMTRTCQIEWQAIGKLRFGTFTKGSQERRLAYGCIKGRSRTLSPALRAYVGKRCPYCGQKMKNWQHRRPTRDHVIPRSKGGNVTIVVCSACNSAKGDMMPDDWLVWLEANLPWRAPAVAVILGTNP